MDYKKISQDVVDHVGGISNIKGATHCVTRLRLILNDETKYDRKALENIEGVKGVLFNSGQLNLKQKNRKKQNPNFRVDFLNLSLMPH